MKRFKSLFERAVIRYDIKKREMSDRAFAKNEFLRGAQGDEGSVHVLSGKLIMRAVLGKIVMLVITIIVVGFVIFTLMYLAPRDILDKPVIYLYPKKPTKTTVRLNFDGVLEVTYPEYHDGWSVTAHPDGKLINHRDDREYSYLFWEGSRKTDYDLSKGFVVKGEDTVEFLQDKLSFMGLMPKEYNEFIVYWLPKMQSNAYNLITFQGKDYTDSAELVITPEPDSVLRIFMAFKPLNKPVEIEEQVLETFARTGFAVVEWGGCIL